MKSSIYSTGCECVVEELLGNKVLYNLKYKLK